MAGGFEHYVDQVIGLYRLEVGGLDPTVEAVVATQVEAAGMFIGFVEGLTLSATEKHEAVFAAVQRFTRTVHGHTYRLTKGQLDGIIRGVYRLLSVKGLLRQTGAAHGG
jgi:hypothetical protein